MSEALSTLTWDQAQFERFSYILPAGMLFTKRNENRAWSQVILKPTAKCTFIIFFGPNIAKADSRDEEMNRKPTKDNSPV